MLRGREIVFGGFVVALFAFVKFNARQDFGPANFFGVCTTSRSAPVPHFTTPGPAQPFPRTLEPPFDHL
jgi:hypothetical protein